jgi:hypothetical protein
MYFQPFIHKLWNLPVYLSLSEVNMKANKPVQIIPLSVNCVQSLEIANHPRNSAIFLYVIRFQ